MGGGEGLINFPPVKRGVGFIREGGGLFEKGGLIEDSRYHYLVVFLS